MLNLNLKTFRFIVFICVIFCEKCLSYDSSETIIDHAIKSSENERATEKEVWIPKLISKFYYVDKLGNTATIKNEESATFSNDSENIKSTKKRIAREINYGRSSMYPAGTTPYPIASNYVTYKTPFNHTYYGVSPSSNFNNYSVTQKYPHNQFYPTRQYSTTLNYPSQNPVSDRPPYYPTLQNSYSTNSSFPHLNNYYQNTSYHQSSKPNQIVYYQNSFSNNQINVSSPRTLYPFSRYVNISQNAVNYPHSNSVGGPISNVSFSHNYANSMNGYLHTNNNTLNNSKNSTIMYYNRMSNFTTNNPWNVPSSNVNYNRHEIPNISTPQPYNSVPNLIYNSSRAYYPSNPTYHNSNHTLYQSHHYPQNTSTYPGHSVYNTNSNTFYKENLNVTAPKPLYFLPQTSFNSSFSSYPTNPTSSWINYNQNNFTHNNSFQSQGIEPNHFFFTPGNKTVSYDPYKMQPYNFSYGQPK